MCTVQERANRQIAAWFATTIRREGIRLRRKRARIQAHEKLYLDAPHGIGEWNSGCVHLSNGVDTEAVVIERLFLECTLAPLTSRQRVVLWETVIQDTSEQSVAMRFGISQQAVHRLKARALEKIKGEWSL